MNTWQLENPITNLCIGDKFDIIFEKFDADKFSPSSYKKNKYLSFDQLISLSGIQHSIGMEFLDGNLYRIHLGKFTLPNQQNEDKYKIIQDSLIKIFGNPTKMALQKDAYNPNHQNRQSQWIFADQYELTHNQIISEGMHLIYFGKYEWAILDENGFWEVP